MFKNHRKKKPGNKHEQIHLIVPKYSNNFHNKVSESSKIDKSFTMAKKTSNLQQISTKKSQLVGKRNKKRDDKFLAAFHSAAK